MTKTLKIEGMSCAHCAGAVTKALKAVGGVGGVTVDLEGKSAAVEITGAATDEALRAAVEDAGFEVAEIM